jgi:hypothetical protein
MALANYPFDFYTAHSEQQVDPNTIASAATITPVHRFTRVTGTTPVTRIIPPIDAYHELVFIWTTGTANGFTTGVTLPGGISVTTTTVTNVPMVLFYDPRTKLYYAG